MSNRHVKGFPVGATTYEKQKCRCDGCRAEHARKMRRMRQKGKTRLLTKVATRRRYITDKWVRENMPNVYDVLNAQAKEHVYMREGVWNASESEH